MEASSDRKEAISELVLWDLPKNSGNAGKSDSLRTLCRGARPMRSSPLCMPVRG